MGASGAMASCATAKLNGAHRKDWSAVDILDWIENRVKARPRVDSCNCHGEVIFGTIYHVVALQRPLRSELDRKRAGSVQTESRPGYTTANSTLMRYTGFRGYAWLFAGRSPDPINLWLYLDKTRPDTTCIGVFMEAKLSIMFKRARDAYCSLLANYGR